MFGGVGVRVHLVFTCHVDSPKCCQSPFLNIGNVIKIKQSMFQMSYGIQFAIKSRYEIL